MTGQEYTPDAIRRWLAPTVVNGQEVFERHDNVQVVRLAEAFVALGENHDRLVAQLAAGDASVVSDAPNLWDPTVPPGGYVCSTCKMPTESEPCQEHQPTAYTAMTGPLVWVVGTYEFGYYLECSEHGAVPVMPADPGHRMTAGELYAAELRHRWVEHRDPNAMVVTLDERGSSDG